MIWTRLKAWFGTSLPTNSRGSRPSIPANPYPPKGLKMWHSDREPALTTERPSRYRYTDGRYSPRTISCLCGSTRFMEQFHEVNRRLSLRGIIVLTVEIVTYDGSTDPQKADPEQKARLDELHLAKIDLADEIVVINVNDYIGTSTINELNYARHRGKRVRWYQYPSRHAYPEEFPLD